MSARLLYVMDPMCSWCWGFAPVLESLAEQAAAAGVPPGPPGRPAGPAPGAPLPGVF